MAGAQGSLLVLREHVVHLRDSAARIVLKSGGAFAPIPNVDLYSSRIRHDRDGFCWISNPHECDAGSCTTDTKVFEQRIYCWNPAMSEPLLIPLPATPTWLAMSPTKLVFGAADGVWITPRPH